MRKFLMVFMATALACFAMVGLAFADAGAVVEVSWLARIGEYWVVITQVVTLAAAVAAVTPSPKDDGVVAAIRRIIDLLALNFGFAKNKDR